MRRWAQNGTERPFGTLAAFLVYKHFPKQSSGMTTLGGKLAGFAISGLQPRELRFRDIQGRREERKRSGI